MPNKINSLIGTSTPVGAGGHAEKSRDASSGSSSAAGSSPGDVHITGSASMLAALEQQLRGLPAVNEARVAQFRTAIEGGSYTIHPGQVADQLMQIEHCLAQIGGG